MGLDFQKTVVSTGVTIWSTVHETATGGFTIDKTGLPSDYIIPAGTPIAFDESTRMAKVLKAIVLHQNSGITDTSIPIAKGSAIVVGEYYAVGVGGIGRTVTAIDKSSPDFDLITLSGNFNEALNAGSGLFQSSDAAQGTLMGVPKGLSYEDTDLSQDDSLSIVLRGTLYARRAPVAGDSIRQVLPLIIFSQSF